ncbi:MAG: alpha-glucan family phosphorylase [Bdellovibrionales bacterium]|nr:alpha-glucan family phosphorylase [Bdellovibrionales bacterium]
MNDSPTPVAYFTMEIALEPEIRTYSGGLGVLAGDTARSAADLRVPLVVVTLLHRKGYFRQEIAKDGTQIEHDGTWPVEQHLQRLDATAQVEIEGRPVLLRVWRYDVVGQGGFVVPVHLIDTSDKQNSEYDQTLTDYLYGGDKHYRLCQEAVLGIGGVRILRALGYNSVRKYHMNEGHASLLTLELLDERLRAEGRTAAEPDDIVPLRKMCVFTTHTPVEAGHDRFDQQAMERVLGARKEFEMKDGFCSGGVCNMTYLGFNMSSFINGVARKHGEVSREMFDNYSIDSITNGIHAATFASPSMKKLFDKYIPSWNSDNFRLRYAMSIPHHEIWEAHLEAKRRLLSLVQERCGQTLDENVFTIGFARRVATYKRADLIFNQLKRLRDISKRSGKFQLIFAGKAHPADVPGKELMKRVFDAKRELGDDVPIAYIEDYDLEMGKIITAGVDTWLNTPRPPLEASGTSGMKAALNGVPSFSVLDGWWIEGWIEGVTGWSISTNGGSVDSDHDDVEEAQALYRKLEEVILPCFYRERVRFLDIMRHSIALNGSFFNTERMMKEYVLKAYFT